MNRPTHAHIWLIGFSGSGKSSIGPHLAKLLGRRFFDTDAIIARRTRTSIAQLFASEGERRFRKLEADLIQELAAKRASSVIALGGGAFTSGKNRKVVRATGLSVYLKASPSLILKRLADKSDRPLLQVHAARGETLRQARLRRINDMLDKRTAHYEDATLTIPVSRGSAFQLARRIAAKVEALNG